MPDASEMSLLFGRFQAVDQSDHDGRARGRRQLLEKTILQAPCKLPWVGHQPCRGGYTSWESACGGSMTELLVVADPDIQSGAPVFAGTGVPIQNLFDYLEEGDSLDVFLRQFPSVTREQAVAVLEQARATLVADAHPA
jgi:uncharacterized protein (DUF433 family)